MNIVQMMMQNFTKNIAKSDVLYQNLTENEELSNLVTFFPKMERSFNFRVKLVRPNEYVREIHGMSVSYPSDKNGILETVLLGEFPLDEDGNINIFGAPIIYDNECGYDNVCEFEEIDDLIKEIHIILEYLSPHYVHIDQDDQNDSGDEGDQQLSKTV